MSLIRLSVRRVLSRAATSMSTAVGGMLLACSGAPEPNESSEMGVAPGSIFEALSNTEECGAAPANKGFKRTFPLAPFTTSASYGSSKCGGAYLVDLEEQRLVSGEKDRVEYGDSVPTNSAECLKHRVGVYVWKQSTQQFLGSTWSWATWSNQRCNLPSIDLSAAFGLTMSGVSYRVAATARRYATAGDAGSSWQTRKLRFFRDTSAAAIQVTNTTRCWENGVNTNPLTGYQGKAINEYRLYRKIGAGSYQHVQSWPGVTEKFTFPDKQIEPARGIEHSYRVRGVAADGTETPYSNIVTATNTAALCQAPAESKVGLLLTYRSDDTRPISRADLRRMVFDTNEPTSIANYFDEASYGKLTFSEHFATTWQEIPRDIEISTLGLVDDNWSGGYTDEYLEWVKQKLLALEAQNGLPDRWLVITNNALGSKAYHLTNVPTPFVGGVNFETPSKGLKQAVHELGHSYKLHHTGSTVCGDLLFPDSPNLPPGCEAHPYGPYDVMGGDLLHYNGLHKHVLGWIPRSDVVSLTLDPNSDNQEVVELHDLNASTGKRLIEMRLPGGERFYADYRRPLGFNAGVLDDEPVGEGVYVYWAPAKALTCGGVEPCLDPSRDAPLFTVNRPHPGRASRGNPFTIANRRLEILVFPPRNQEPDPEKMVVQITTGI